jgi:hypothetical protein
VCVLLAGCNRPAEQPAQDTTAPVPAAPAAPAPLTSGWTVTDGIDAPESAYVDAESGFVFVSQIGGAPDAKDGNGRIVKLGGDGKVIAANWVTGLNAPKGLRACQGTLWVSDIGEVVGIEIASGRISSRVALPDAQFPNDVACGGDGTIYVSDMIGNKIFAVQNGTPSVFAEGEMLEWPNGLLVEDARLIVGGWGRPEADFTTKVPGRLFALDLKTKAKTLITPKPFANIDGVELDGRGGYIVTDYLAGKVMQVSAAGEVRELRKYPAGTADHAFVAAGNVLIVPHMNENKVASYDVSDALK